MPRCKKSDLHETHRNKSVQVVLIPLMHAVLHVSARLQNGLPSTSSLPALALQLEAAGRFRLSWRQRPRYCKRAGQQTGLTMVTMDFNGQPPLMS